VATNAALAGPGTLALGNGSGTSAGQASNYTLMGGTDTVTITSGSTPTPTPTPAPAAQIHNATLAMISWPQFLLNSEIKRIRTPYGTSQTGPHSQYTGNRKKTRGSHVEANMTLKDFKSGLNLRILDGGVRKTSPQESKP
jgi:hypothetical protein